MNRAQVNHERRGSGSFFGITLFSIFLLFALNNNALAQAPVTYNFTTDVPGFTGGCPACLFEDQPVSGSFVYDRDADLLGINPQGLSIYLGAISNWSGSIGSNLFSDDLGLTIVGDDFVGGTRDLLSFTPGLFLEGFEIDGYTLVDVRMMWLEGIPGDPAGNPDFLLDQNLPAALPDFPGFLLLDFENPLNPEIVFTVNFENLIVTRAPTSVTIDIKPGSSPNSINPTSRGNIPVAILTTDTFDATQLDFETVVFGPNGATESHGRAHVTDIDEDGDADLILHFNTQDTGIQCGDTEATLTGETFDGQAITGSNAISTVPCPAPVGVTYDFTQTFGNIAVSGTLTFVGSVPDSISVDDLNTLATWDLSFSTIVPDPVFPLEPFSLSDSDSSWATELIPGTSVQIDATATELVFDLMTPFATNAAVVLMSDGPDFRQFRFGQVNQPGFVGTQIVIQGIDIASEFSPLPFDAALAFPAVSTGSAP